VFATEVERCVVKGLGVGGMETWGRCTKDTDINSVARYVLLFA
jgi:hypothetical protein